MVSPFLNPLLCLSAAACLLAGCRHTPEPSGRTLVSVSWVNPSPTPMEYLETTVGDHTILLEHLPPYRELSRETNLSLPQHPRVSTSYRIGAETLTLPTAFVETPRRKSPTGEYNLRIHMVRDETARLKLEPANVARARLRSATTTR